MILVKPRCLGCTLGVCVLVPMLAVAQAPPQADRLREAFQRLDANADSFIERDEVPDEAVPAFNRLLARGDTNADAKLSAEELRGLVQRAAQAPAARLQAVRERLQSMDANKDGRIDRAEYQGPAAIFDRLDTNKDGAISKDDRRPNQRP